jgi:hypothetical protein
MHDNTRSQLLDPVCFLYTQNLNGEGSPFSLTWRALRGYFLRHRVTSFDTKLLPPAVKGSNNFVLQEVTWEGSPYMDKSYFLLCAFSVEKSNFYVMGSNLGGLPI